MRILNLYCGIGGNRKLWTPNGNDHQITAVEWDKEIAAIYSDFFPQDEVIVADAHQFLLDHYKEYDFIWSSPPCPSHSDIRRCGVQAGQYDALYPDMSLYQEILLLRHFAKCNWIIENVKPYYAPLISAVPLQRHLFWSNMHIPQISVEADRETVHCKISDTSTIYGVSLEKYNIDNKRKILRNMASPEIGKYLLDIAMATPFKHIQEEIAI